jgi:hypothetical protein
MENPEKPKGAVQNGKSRETGNIWYKTKNKDRQNKKYNTVCVGRHYTQTNTNTYKHKYLQTPGGKIANKLWFPLIIS